MTEKIEAKVTHRFRASPERLYDVVLDPVLAPRWHEAWLRHGGLAGEVTTSSIDPKEGGKFAFVDRRNGQEARHWGTYLRLERPTKISFTWITDAEDEADPSEVTLIIEPEPNGPGSIATLYHTMDARWADYLTQTEKGWIAMLEGVEDVIEGRA